MHSISSELPITRPAACDTRVGVTTSDQQEQDHGKDDGGHDHEHDHEHDHGPLSAVRHFFGGHSHDVSDQVDSELEASHVGTRALGISLVVLGVTTLLQAGVVVISGSVALLGDTLHNLGDALTAVPLGLAFVIGRRPANDRYTYGYGRGEDLAGMAVVLVILTSAVVAGYEAINRLVHPQKVHALGWVAAAAVVGFIGNEVAARVRITTGRRIGSAALVADGLHARTDGITSLAVLFGAGGVALGWPWADPAIGLLITITIAIAVVVRNAARSVCTASWMPSTRNWSPVHGRQAPPSPASSRLNSSVSAGSDTAFTVRPKSWFLALPTSSPLTSWRTKSNTRSSTRYRA